MRSSEIVNCRALLGPVADPLVGLGSQLYGEPDAISRSHDAVIRVCDEAGNVIATHEHAGDFREW
jgi:hypothetical protein